MALNLDTAVRIAGKVTGLNEFKDLADRLQNVDQASQNSRSSFEQLSSESNRLAQTTTRTLGGIRNQSQALQQLQAATRSSTAEMRQQSAEGRTLGGVFQQIRGQSAGLMDGVTVSVSRSSGAVKEFRRNLAPTDTELAKVRDQVLRLGDSSKQTERSLKNQVETLKNLRSQAEINGTLYQKLSGDIERLNGVSTQAANNIRNYGAATSKSSEAIGKQIADLARLQTSLKAAGVDMGSAAQQIQSLKQRAVDLGTAWEPGIRGLKLLGKAAAESTDQQAGQMTRLQGILKGAGDGYRALGREIDNLRQKAAGLDLSKGLQLTPGNVASGVSGAVRGIVQMRQDLSRSMMGRVVLTGEGLAAAGVAGAAGVGAASGLGGLATGAQATAASLDAIAAKAAALPGLLKPLGSLLSEPASAAAAGVTQWAGALTAAQGKLAALAAPFEAIGTAISSIGPEASAAAGVASLAIAGVYQVLKRQADAAEADLEASFRGISDAAQQTLQNLVRIYDRVPNARLQAQQELRDRNMQRLGEVPSDSVEARRAANAVVTAEREIERIKLEQNNLIEQARRGEQQRSAEVLAQVQVARDRLETQRRLTAEVKRTAEEDRQARQIAGSIRRNEEKTRPEREALAQQQTQLEALRDQARRRLELQQQQTAAVKAENQALAEQQAIAGSIRRNQERVAAEQDRLRRAAAAAYAPSAVLALPAAGQTSFAGIVNAQGLGGGARRLSNYETAGTRDLVGDVMGSRTAQAMQATAQATTQARGKLAELFLTIDRVTAASNGSISSLQRQRAAWEALRLAVNPAAPAYANATAKVKALDEQLQRLTLTQEKAAKAPSLRREAVGSALGSLAAGGGLQGAAGALAGSLAFSGSAAGLAAGAGVSAAIGVGALAVRVGVDAETAQVRLKALTDQFGEYNQAQAAAARIAGTLRISTTEAQDSFSKLYAALRPTGVTLQEIEDAFVGFTAAARASGATAEESSYALLQLKQALGSGVLQGDELRSIREQAPAVGQAIAREMGVTIGELKKLGSEGQITTDIVLRALAKLKNEKLDQLNAQFDTSAQAIKDLQIATEDFGRTIARVFGPTAVALLRGFTAALEGVNLTFNALGGQPSAQQVIQDRQRARAQAQQDTNARPFAWWDLNGKSQFFQQREEQLFRQYQQGRTGAADVANTSQRAAQQSAAQERAAAQARAADAASSAAQKAADKAQKDQEKLQRDQEQAQQAQLDFQNDLFDIRLNAEKRLADFRQQSLERVTQMERDLGDQRLQLERSTEELQRQAAGQLQDFYLQMERDRLAAIGGDTSALDIEIEATQARRKASEDIIRNEQSAADRKLQLDRSIEDYKVSVAKGIREILIDAAERWSDRMREGAKGAAGVLGGVTGGGSMARVGGGAVKQYITGDPNHPNYMANHGGSNYHDHLAFIDRATAVAAYKYFQSRGLTVTEFKGYTRVGRHYGPDHPAGLAFDIPGSQVPVGQERALSQRVRAVLAEFVAGRGGVAAAPAPANNIRSLPAELKPVAPMQPLNPASLEVPGMAGILAARDRLNAASDANRAAADLVARNQPLESLQGRFGEITQPLGQQRRSSQEQLQDFQRILQLQRTGLSPELAQQSVERARMAERETLLMQSLQNQTVEYLKQSGLTDDQREAAQLLLEATRDRATELPIITAAMDREAATLERLKELEQQRQDLINGTASAIGNGLTGAMDLLIEGTDNWGNSLREIASGVLKDIAKQITQTMVIQPVVKGLQGVLGGAFAMGGVMTDRGPLPLRAYSNGGVASTPQLALFGEGRRPEAYVPLPDGRRIPVALQGGGGGSTVNVTVNADGSAVAGDSGQSEQLGRAVAAAIQQELIKQRRPGGLLANR